MRYRILYHHRIRADDGQAVHVRELIAALRGLGHDVRECALVPKAGGGATGATADDAAGARRDRPWQRLRLPRLCLELLEVGYHGPAMRMLQRAARDLRPDFVYERHALHCRAGLAAARRLGVPLLLEVNAPMCDEMERLGALRLRRRARRAEREVLGGASAVLAVTAVLRDRLIECGARPERCHVIHNAGDPSRYGEAARAEAARLRARFPAGAFVLGFVGYARPWHRLDLALAAMAQPGLERVHLVLVGEGPALAGVRAQATALGLNGRVHAAGVVTPDRLAAHVCAFDAAIVPAINAYASPLKLFDALAAGVVALAPDQPNLRECIDDGASGVLFTPGDAVALAAKLRQLAGDRAGAAAIGTAGRGALLARDWTWAGNARRVVEVYEGLAR